MKRAELKLMMKDALSLAREYRTTYQSLSGQVVRMSPGQKAGLITGQQIVLRAWLAQIDKYDRIAKQYFASIRSAPETLF